MSGLTDYADQGAGALGGGPGPAARPPAGCVFGLPRLVGYAIGLGASAGIGALVGLAVGSDPAPAAAFGFVVGAGLLSAAEQLRALARHRRETAGDGGQLLAPPIRSTAGPARVVVSNGGRVDQKIALIKAIREATGLGLKDAKDLGDRVVMGEDVEFDGLSADAAQAFVRAVRDLGAEARVDASRDGTPGRAPASGLEPARVDVLLGPGVRIGSPIQLIKAVRTATGLGLADAKGVVDRLCEGHAVKLDRLAPDAAAELVRVAKEMGTAARVEG